MQPNEPSDLPVRNRRSDRYSPVSAYPQKSPPEKLLKNTEQNEFVTQKTVHGREDPGLPGGTVSVQVEADRKIAPRNRKERKKSLFLPYQKVLLAVLGVLLCIFVFCDIKAASDQKKAADTLNALYAEREKSVADYAREVAAYRTGYRDYVLRYSNEYHLRPAFVAAVISCESSYDPNAVSRVDARGLMQLMPSTGEWIAGKLKIRDFDAQDLFDPETNIRLGCWYLNYLCGLFEGDPVVVACAYHAGQGNVRNWVTKYSEDGVTIDLDKLPSSVNDTKTYVRRIMRAYAIYEQNYYPD